MSNAGAFALSLLQFFIGIPMDLDEMALLDGASRVGSIRNRS